MNTEKFDTNLDLDPEWFFIRHICSNTEQSSSHDRSDKVSHVLFG